MSRLLAQSQVNLGNISGVGSLGGPYAGPASTMLNFVVLISTIIGALSVVAGLWFLFQLIIAGYRWISAGGEKQSVQDAQKRITNSIIGLVIVVSAYALNGLIGYILGLETIDVGGLIINNIHP